ncbi:sister chromatid cohesion 1 protein 4-like isoform X2 [Aristolochia californica]|uniref:sister chromatid cohesion 1 protein 4-like isoform X2 n=1 Tax=Aristolochia californica TaxID=171875 RepID=UPI0035DFDC88
MFYSQFILAKKGPLGTIWIAAHLERKLRKNQVADTDIGVSVDSILFPEVPIALRLSSHLLLGVVRIYSRKVNYLFHDCSEALLNIKQAFRSTAVDLPPEESTAPYHSITLPETFDLDDFELPDNGLFQGNFVDHHISTREQITLQDTMDGIVYSTSQFGPDERFGDGDASQIGLDLDECLLGDKIPSSAHASSPLAREDNEDPQTSRQEDPVFTEMDVDDLHIVQLPAGGPHYQAVQTPDLNEVFPSEPIDGSSVDPDIMEVVHVAPPKSLPSDLTESAQAPSTPGLVQEAIPAHFQETGETSHLESEDLDSGKLVTKDSHSGNSNHEVDCPLNDKGPETPISSGMLQSDSSPTSAWAETKSVSLVVESSTGVSAAPDEGYMDHGEEKLEISQNGAEFSETQDPPSLDESKSTMVPQQDLSDAVDLHNDESVSHQDGHELPATQVVNSVETEELGFTCHVPVACNMLQSETNLLPAVDMMECEEIPPSKEAQLCTKQASHAGGGSSSDGVTATSLGEQFMESSSSKVEEDIASLDAAPKENLSCLITSEFPAPETLVSAPPCGPDLLIDLVQSRAEKDVIVEGEKTVDQLDKVSGKKRKIMESTPDLQTDNSNKLSLDCQSVQCTDFIPDDDDILASILVGKRRTPILKVKATPPPVEVTSSKRTRMTVKATAPNRKVLMDDTMVMQGDAIRQQLTNTDDIRRVRRKAPCTRPEIRMIEKSLLEDEMFTESLFNSLTAELASLPNQEYDTIEDSRLSGDAAAPVEAIVDEVGSHIAVDPGKTNGEVQESHGLDVQTENCPLETDGSSIACVTQGQTEPQIDTPQFNLLENAKSSDLASMEIDMQDKGVTDNDTHVDSQINNGSALCPDSNSTAQLPENFEMKNETVDATLDEVVATAEQDVEVLVQTEGSAAPMVKDVSISEDNRGTISLDEDMLTLSQEKQKDGEELTNVVDGGQAVSVVSSVFEGSVNPSFPDVTVEGGETAEHAKGEEVTEGEAVLLRVEPEVSNLSSELNFDGSHMKEETTNIPSNEGEIPGSHEADTEIVVDGEMLLTVGDACDFGIILEENDTDDEAEPVEEEDNSISNNEVDRFFENSGWSSRTRAVARYLKSLFEDGGRRKVVPVDNLLAGKSRKEASRMFFETLVLKTKDYVHVEQENPFGNMNITPRTKLMKSDL